MDQLHKLLGDAWFLYSTFTLGVRSTSRKEGQILTSIYDLHHHIRRRKAPRASRSQRRKENLENYLSFTNISCPGFLCFYNLCTVQQKGGEKVPFPAHGLKIEKYKLFQICNVFLNATGFPSNLSTLLSNSRTRFVFCSRFNQVRENVQPSTNQPI